MKKAIYLWTGSEVLEFDMLYLAKVEAKPGTYCMDSRFGGEPEYIQITDPRKVLGHTELHSKNDVPKEFLATLMLMGVPT